MLAALAHDAAVGFHCDDADNIERVDWEGQVSCRRALDWKPQPSRAPPHSCIYTSNQIPSRLFVENALALMAEE